MLHNIHTVRVRIFATLSFVKLKKRRKRSNFYVKDNNALERMSLLQILKPF